LQQPNHIHRVAELAHRVRVTQLEQLAIVTRERSPIAPAAGSNARRSGKREVSDH